MSFIVLLRMESKVHVYHFPPYPFPPSPPIMFEHHSCSQSSARFIEFLSNNYRITYLALSRLNNVRNPIQNMESINKKRLINILCIPY